MKASLLVLVISLTTNTIASKFSSTAGMTTEKLSSDFDFPFVGLGTWQAAPGVVGSAVETALLSGYKHIDCAWIYGNQKEIGAVFKKVFEKDVKREDVFITSKIWNTAHSFERCKAQVDDILDQLQLKYLDLLLIHWPHGYEEGEEALPKTPDGLKMRYSDVDYVETWRALEEAVKEGKVRSIGISNFNHTQIERILESGSIKPAVLQVELHPHFQQRKLREFCKEKGIALTAYSSLGNPGSTMFRKEGDPNALLEPKVVKIASDLGKSPAQVVLKWAVQHGIHVIPKSTNEGRIRENLDLFNFSLNADQMAEIDSLDAGWRLVNLTARDGDHPHFPFNEEY